MSLQIYSALEATPEHGREFAAAVKHILSWEDTWTAWKKAGCPADPMQRPPAKMPANAPAAADLCAWAPLVLGVGGCGLLAFACHAQLSLHPMHPVLCCPSGHLSPLTSPASKLPWPSEILGYMVLQEHDPT